jgi:hypothetical protein
MLIRHDVKEAALYLGLMAVLSFGVITPIMIFARSSSQPRKGDGPRGQRRGVGAVTEIV